jgi:polyisoprenoid-binding protein YceI
VSCRSRDDWTGSHKCPNVLHMAVAPGSHRLGPETGHIMLRTGRDGLVAQAGHDLSIEVTTWSGDLTIGDDGIPTALEVRVRVDSLSVREGRGGIRPLTDRDRREIAHTARKLLGTDRHPEAVFTAAQFKPANGGGLIEGTFTLRGNSQPLQLEVTENGPDRYRATGAVVQSAYGFKPYTAFLGTLKVRDAVDVEVDVDMSAVAKTGE